MKPRPHIVLQALFKHLGIYFLDQRTYYRLLRTTIYPVVWCMWLVHQSEVLQEARVNKCLALHCTALHCTALHCTALHCTALHCTALHCTALHYTAPHCTALLLPTLHTRMHKILNCLFSSTLRTGRCCDQLSCGLRPLSAALIALRNIMRTS
jgi:hypothetical protein